MCYTRRLLIWCPVCQTINCSVSTAHGNVKDTSTQKAERKKDWTLTQDALGQLLAWLDEGSDSGGEKYLEMRRRLVSYFDRKNCLAPDELADETLNRVARRLEEEGSITDITPAHYCYIVARYVFMEYLRRTERSQVNIDELPGSSHAFLDLRSDEREIEQRRLACLEECLQKLDQQSREIIIQYYHGEQRAKIENRRALAEALGITMNALSIRACRIRERLEIYVIKSLSR